MLIALLAGASGGCQAILDEIDVDTDAALDALEQDAGARDAAREGGERSGAEDGGANGDAPGSGLDGDAPGGGPAGDASGGGPADAAPGAADAGEGHSGADAASMLGDDASADAAGAGASDAASDGAAGAHDGATPAQDADLPCTEPVWWYEDGDGDGYGRASARVQACPAPASDSWALEAGDCNDDDPRVYPGQPEYFGEPYRAPGGAESFDYDCSGGEEGNGQQSTLASGACGLLTLALCGGDGYLPVRAGAPNPWCGSHERATCQGAALGLLLCEEIVNDVREPYWCR